VSRRGLVLYTRGYARYAAFIASEAKQRSSKSLDGATGQVARSGILMIRCLNSICTTQGGLMSSATNLPHKVFQIVSLFLSASNGSQHGSRVTEEEASSDGLAYSIGASRIMPSNSSGRRSAMEARIPPPMEICTDQAAKVCRSQFRDQKRRNGGDHRASRASRVVARRLNMSDDDAAAAVHTHPLREMPERRIGLGGQAPAHRPGDLLHELLRCMVQRGRHVSMAGDEVAMKLVTGRGIGIARRGGAWSMAWSAARSKNNDSLLTGTNKLEPVRDVHDQPVRKPVAGHIDADHAGAETLGVGPDGVLVDVALRIREAVHERDDAAHLSTRGCGHRVEQPPPHLACDRRPLQLVVAAALLELLVIDGNQRRWQERTPLCIAGLRHPRARRAALGRRRGCSRGCSARTVKGGSAASAGR
jgi:hypothetical protein